jgi:predicted phage baseplate assembly protein
LDAVPKIQQRARLVGQWTNSVAGVLSTGGRESPLLSTQEWADLKQRLTDGFDALHAGTTTQTTATQTTAGQVVEYLNSWFPANDTDSTHISEFQGLAAIAAAIAKAVTDGNEGWYVVAAQSALDSISDILTTLVRLCDPSEYLAFLNRAVAVVRQQQRIAAAGSYPRVSPWLDVLLGTFDQLMSDLKVKAYAAPTTDEQLPDSPNPLASLGSLLSPPGQPAPPAVPTAPVGGGTGAPTAPKEIGDLGPQVAAGFNPGLKLPLYNTLANAKVVRRQRFQAAHALRARAAPFGHNAQPRPVLDAAGAVGRTEEWPLRPFTLREAVSFRIKSVSLAVQSFRSAVVELQVTDAAGHSFPLLEASPVHGSRANQVSMSVAREEAVATDPNSVARITVTVALPGGAAPKLVCELPKSPTSVIRVQGATLQSGEIVRTEDWTDDHETDWLFGFDQQGNGSVLARTETRVPGKPPPKNQLRLDTTYDKVTPGSFVVIERAAPPSGFKLDNPLVARVEAVASVSVADYGMPATRVTVLTLDRPWLTDDDTMLSDIRDVTVYLQSEPLVPAGEPYDADIGPVADGDPGGSAIELDSVYDGLSAGRLLIVAGERTDVPGTTGVTDAELVVLQASSQVIDQQNTAGQGHPHTRLTLTRPLAHSYQRNTVTVYGNVVPADQGETRNEVLGAGRASAASQRFALKQNPLTYLPAPTPTGAEPQIEVRVSGVLWDRADRFNDLGPNDRGYVLEASADGTTAVLFGDGVHGARLPTGADNVRAKYRAGAGSAGNVAAGKVNQLASRPLGVTGVTNPLPAAGGADAEGTDQARRNAAVGLTALGRLVAVNDYEDFARAFAGVGKARAVRLTDGTAQRVHLTIAGPDGDEIPPCTDLYKNLVKALVRYGDPALPLTVAPRGLQFLVVAAELRVAGGYEFDPVSAAARAALARQYGFAGRDFAQPVYLSDVTGTLQAVEGVEAVRVLQFGTVREKTGDGKLTPLGQIVGWLRDIAKGDAGAADLPGDEVESRATPQPVLIVPDTRFDPNARTIRPAEIAFLTPRVPDLLTLVEWKP